MRPKRPHNQLDHLLSRRSFLIGASLATGSAVAFCGASSLGLYWLLTRASSHSNASYATTTPGPRLAIQKVMAKPSIVTRTEWGALLPNFSAENEHGIYGPENPEGWLEYDGALQDTYQTVVIHHSATYEVDDVNTMREVQRLHMEERGWADIGYHFCVGKTGSIFEGRYLNVRGTHTAGYNTGSAGVCLLGNFEEELPTQEQLEATKALLNWLAVRLLLTHLAGHRDFNDTTLCPGANLYVYLDEFAASAGLTRGTAGYVGPAPEPTSDTTSAIGCCCCDRALS
ncbi:MAG: hypothetical protein CUN55_05550 [Phototrophicales bacterium]|nr:MAG: hypothetical protein CUN55_05550 [Phototrophicales bacterium]